MEDLGAFLYSRRARVTPESVGLRPSARRRVPGLRREEVAHLAGISVEYYQRLEQGRSASPSPAVLDAIAQVLRLDEVERGHLGTLAHPPRRPADHQSAQVRPELRRMLEHMTQIAALVINDRFDVLGANALGARMFEPVLTGQNANPNMARHLFLDPAAADFYLEWSDVAAATAAQLRLVHARSPADTELTALIDDLTTGSVAFGTHWAAGDVELRTAGSKNLRHPEVGVLALHYENLDLPGDPGQRIVTLSPAEDSATKSALRLLSLRTADAP
ncbi:transcriptional regulator with XRE-family HTH domain [Kitasatospora sp. MAA4]|uniref:helix-turn-helix domain-containing protein n=1 Tax=Kitasatospora sp. MAA4 TaxID=3035093 RepID=UPI002475726C|nr:helix-turn-helix transcriptional regulator [Kitasatospora sp. MAA4]MDH6137570.1 transcriptional regulator with XRE-family HTH domain [Kitasatospora sp. MAA4]